MKLYDAGIVLILILLAVGIVGRQAHKWSDRDHCSGREEFRGHDGPVESAMESVHYAITGEKVDFTPESPACRLEVGYNL